MSITSLAAGSFDELADRVHYAGYIFVGIIALFLIAVFVGKKVISRLESRHLDISDAKDSTDVKD